MKLGFYYKYPGTNKKDIEVVYNKRRFHHTWVLGKTGQGKSTFLINSAIADILHGDGIAFFDPHGDAIDTICQHIPPEKVVLFDPSDRKFPIGFNPIHNIPKHEIPFVASALVDTFKAVWGYDDMSTPQLDQYLYNGIAALAEVPDGTLLGLKYLITSEKYRSKVLSFVTDPIIKDFWETDFDELMPEREKRANTLSTLNKIGALISDPKLRNVVGQPTSTIDLNEIIDKGYVLLVRLPQGKLGIQKSAMMGAILMSQLHLAALHRKGKMPFHIYADEAHHFGTNTLEEMLSGIRKFNVSLVLANQYIDQLSRTLRSAIIGTVGTILAFRLGVIDADIISKEIGVEPRDLTSLSPYTTWGSEFLDMPDIEFPVLGEENTIRMQSRLKYAVKQSYVEQRLRKFVEGT